MHQLLPKYATPDHQDTSAATLKVRILLLRFYGGPWVLLPHDMQRKNIRTSFHFFSSQIRFVYLYGLYFLYKCQILLSFTGFNGLVPILPLNDPILPTIVDKNRISVGLEPYVLSTDELASPFMLAMPNTIDTIA